MITIDGISGAWNYTIGSVFRWEGPQSLAKVNASDMPLVIVAKYIPIDVLGRIDFPRVLGFVIEEGGPGDPTMIIFSNQHRATVLQAAGALEAARPGETVVVDGVNAKVFFEPDEATLERYKELRRQGPPPEPPGMIDKLMKVATDFKSLDPSALKADIFDFKELGAVMDGVMAIWRKERPTSQNLKDIKAFAKGKPVEDSILKNLDRYDKWLDENPPEDEREKAEKAAKKEAGRGSRGREQDVDAAKRDDARGSSRRERDAEGEAKSDAKPDAGAPAGAAGGASAATAGASGDAAPAAGADAVAADDNSPEARKARRDAEIAKARAARRGT